MRGGPRNAALETGGVLVGTQVNITLEIELINPDYS